jgi:AcrR family transcriptional regulator
MVRPQEPLIERRHAVSVALEMIDEEGLPSFSVEKLARRLGVRGPSLYHHFADRSELLARVAELILHEVPDVGASDGSGLPWDRRLIDATLQLRRAVVRHHNASALLLEHFPRRLVLPVYEHAAAMLAAAGVPAELHMLLIEGLEKLALGFGLYRPTEDPEGTAFPELGSDEFSALRRSLDADRFGHDELFEAACVAFVEGVKLRIAA